MSVRDMHECIQEPRKEIKMRKTLTIGKIRKDLYKLDPKIGTSALKTGCVLLAAAAYGLDPTVIARVTRYSVPYVQGILNQMHDAGLVVNGRVVGTGWTLRGFIGGKNVSAAKALLFDVYAILGVIHPLYGRFRETRPFARAA
jgi:hypothetical protein